MKKNSPEYWEERIAANTWKTYNSLEDKNRELLEFYSDASKAIKEELYILAEKYSKDGVLTLSEMHKQNRLTELTKNYEKIVFDLGKQVEGSAVNNMHDGFKETYKNVATGLGAESFSMPNKKLMEKLLDEPWRGDSFSGRLWKNQKKLAVGLNDILLTGLQQGKTVTEMAVSLHNFMGQGFNSCHRLVRTETMHYLNSAAMQRYKDADIEYVQIWAAQDERTCKVCGSCHSKAYPIDKCPVIPFHANCRCAIIPCLEEGLIAEHRKRVGKTVMRLDLQYFAESNKDSVLKKIKNGEIGKAEFERCYHYFKKQFEDGVTTPISKVYDSKDRFYHIVDRHKYMMSEKQVDKIVDTLSNPSAIYETKDKFGNIGKCYIENVAEPLLIIDRNGIITAYKPDKAYLDKIRKEMVLWEPE